VIGEIKEKKGDLVKVNMKGGEDKKLKKEKVYKVKKKKYEK
jgi:hypothetical protein